MKPIVAGVAGTVLLAGAILLGRLSVTKLQLIRM